MKLIYLANARLPSQKAHSLQIIKMTEAFARAGLKVELVVAYRRNPDFKKIDPFTYYQIEKNFKIKWLFSLDLIDQPLFKKFGRLPLWIQNLTFALSAFFYLIFKKNTIIYSRDAFSLLFLCFFKKRIFWEVHTFPSQWWLYHYLVKKITGIVVITKHLKEEFLKKGIPSSKILVAPDGVDLKKFTLPLSKKECRKKLNLPLEKKIVLYSGHLFKWKGVYTLLEAARYLNSEILVVFVGGMKYDFKKLKSAQEKLNLTNVLLVGHRPPSEIPLWLKSADILVLPNSAQKKISSVWTSPLKLFEYMAAKRPIIASDLPSLKEVLNQENAFLIPPDSPLILAQTIKKVIFQNDLAKQKAKKAFLDVQKYTWNRRAKKILRFIHARA